MNERIVGHVVSAIVLELVKLFDEGKISLEDTKHMIGFCTDALEEFGGEIADATSLIGDRCTVCLQAKEESELIAWNAESFEDGDPRQGLEGAAYENSFGDKMVGGFVCVDCAKGL